MTEGKTPVQALTFAALMAGLSLLLYIIGSLVPILGFFARLALGVPLVLVALVAKNESYAWGAWLVGLLLLTLIFGPIAGLHYGLAFGLSALALGIILLRGFPTATCLGGSFLVGIIGTGLYYLALFFITGMDLAGLQESLVTMKADILSMYEEAGLLTSLDQAAPGGAADFLAIFDQAFRLMVMVLPSMVIFGVGLQVLVQYGLSLRILRTAGLSQDKPAPFRDWHIPAPFAIPFLLAWTLFLLRDILPWTLLEPVVLNVLLLGSMLAILNGLAWIVYRVRPERFGPGIRLVFVLAVFFFFYGFVIFAGLIGLFDMLLNLRDRQNSMKE